MKAKEGLSFVPFAILLVGVLLRLALFWANPPSNFFDDHFHPIQLWNLLGQAPLPNVCWECYQPPLFYWLSHQFSQWLSGMGIPWEAQLKHLQFLSTFLNLGVLLLIWRFIRSLPISKQAKLICLTLVTFLPRHIYMSAIHGNDAAVYLFSAAAVLMLSRIHFKGIDYFRSTSLGIIVSLALLSKGNAIALLPALMIFLLFITLDQSASFRRLLPHALIIIGIPLIVFGGYNYQKSKQMENPFALNLDLFELEIDQKPGQMDFHTFKPWSFIGQPVLNESNISSFFTALHARVWYDVEPKFLPMEYKDFDFWTTYYNYLNVRSSPLEVDLKSMPLSVRLTGTLLILIGLIPLLFFLVGVVLSIMRILKAIRVLQTKQLALDASLLTLLLFNLVGVIYMVGQYSFYSMVKSAFFLISLGSFIYFIAIGFEKIRIRFNLGRIMIVAVSLISILISWQVWSIFLST